MIGYVRRTWSKTGHVGRWVFGIVTFIVALNALMLIIEASFGGSQEGPQSSAFTTGPSGVAAYSELLERTGHEVTKLRSAPSETELDPSAALIVLDPGDVPAEDSDAIRSFLEDGGLLIAGGPQTDWLEGVLDEVPEWSPEGTFTSQPVAPVPEVDNVESVVGRGQGSWSDSRDAAPFLSGNGMDTASVAVVDEGRVVLLADPSPISNALLDQEDNAALGLSIVGDSGEVVFAESFHGFHDRGGLAALPLGWRWFTAGLLFAFVLFMWSRGKRLGPPDRPARELAPPRSLYPAAIAMTLERTRSPDEAVRPVKDRIRNLLQRRTGMPADAEADEVGNALKRLGLDPALGRSLSEPAQSKRDVIALGWLLSQLEKGDM